MAILSNLSNSLATDCVDESLAWRNLAVVADVFWAWRKADLVGQGDLNLEILTSA